MNLKFRNAYDGNRYNKPTAFDEIIDEYEWSDTLQRPVLVGKINLQEQIQQYADCALDKILSKFLPEEEIPRYLGDLVKTAQFVDDGGVVNEEAPNYEDLATLSEIYDKAESYRETFGLADDLSVADIYRIVGEQAQKLGKSLDDLKKQAEEKKKTPDQSEEKENGGTEK